MSVTITWQKSTSTHNSQQLHRSTDGSAYSLLTTIGDNITENYVDSTATIGATYHYKMRVDNGGTLSGWGGVVRVN